MSTPPLLIERRAQQAFNMTTTKAHDDGLGQDLALLLDEAGITNLVAGCGYMAPGVDPSHLVSEVVTILGAAGGLGGIAAILKTFFGRHKGTTVKFGEDGKVLQAAGLSVDDIIRLLDRCSPPLTPDDILVVRDVSDTSGSEKSCPDYMVPDRDSDLAMRAARGRSRVGLPQEVVVHGDGEPRVIRRYEDGHEVPRPPGCPPWCDEGSHENPHPRQVRHGRTIGMITRPDGIQVHVGTAQDSGGQDLVTVTGWAPSGHYGDPQVEVAARRALQTQLAHQLAVPAEVADRIAMQMDHTAKLNLPAEHAAQLAELAGLLGLPDLAVHLRNAAATITTAGPAAGETVSDGKRQEASPATGAVTGDMRTGTLGLAAREWRPTVPADEDMTCVMLPVII
jgi:hypothetical protein